MAETISMKDAQGKDEKQGRERSSIEFPYGDLDDAVDVAKNIYNNAGMSCTYDQLAAYMKQAISGAFRLKISTARIFGLTENERGSGELNLTDLGRNIVNAEKEKTARAEAFLRVPLYKAIYEKYKGHMLPPRVALEREMLNLGVSSKQTDKARQAFERSAEQAGFFAHGSDRLVIPAVNKLGPETRKTESPAPKQEEHKRVDSIGNGHGGGGHHPFIQGLLATLPENGKDWCIAEQVKWLQTAASIFGLIYHADDGRIKIEIDG